jgi:hypothetical protein
MYKKQKKRPILDITGFFFHMNTQVKAEVRSPKAVTWVRMRKKKPGKFSCFNNSVCDIRGRIYNSFAGGIIVQV